MKQIALLPNEVTESTKSKCPWCETTCQIQLGEKRPWQIELNPDYSPALHVKVTPCTGYNQTARCTNCGEEWTISVRTDLEK